MSFVKTRKPKILKQKKKKKIPCKTKTIAISGNKQIEIKSKITLAVAFVVRDREFEDVKFVSHRVYVKRIAVI
jgi:ribosomal protein L16/L10AE